MHERPYAPIEVEAASRSVLDTVPRLIGRVLVFAVALISIVTAQAAPKAPPPDAAWNDFTQMFDTAVDGDHIVGAGVVLVRDGRIVEHHEHGFADRDRSIRITPRSIYPG